MDKKIFMKNTSYVLGSNMASFVINAIIVFLIPKLIGVAPYGFFQFYTLLAAYALYMHFGWCDGIYLRYVGSSYDELDRPLLASQFAGICVMSLAITISILIGTRLIPLEPNRFWIFSFIAVVICLVTPKTYTSVILQATNRMKAYSQVIIAEKVIYAVILCAMLLIGIRDYKILILSDIVGKIAALCMGLYFCRDIVATKFHWRRSYLRETKKNITVGAFLLISNLASILITGIIQFAIENKWSIEAFSKVSLSLNISKMLLVAITAVSIVLVPVLKHFNRDQLATMYGKIRSALMLILSALMIAYYPLKVIIYHWLPQYSESLIYMAFLFPMCLFESKTSLLVNTYLKAMRFERALCAVNVGAVLLSALFSFVTIHLLDNLNLAVVSITYIFAIRCFVLEYFIGKELKINVLKDAFIEVILATCFIVLNYYCSTPIACALYSLVFLFYLLLNKKYVRQFYDGIKRTLTKKKALRVH